MTKFWYEVETESGYKVTFNGKSGKAIARQTAKELSTDGGEAWINGYDVCEVWRGGKRYE